MSRRDLDDHCKSTMTSTQPARYDIQRRRADRVPRRSPLKWALSRVQPSANGDPAWRIRSPVAEQRPPLLAAVRKVASAQEPRLGRAGSTSRSALAEQSGPK